MRFVVLGAGAIGGVVGARLAKHGQDVLLVARGAHYEAIRDNGLRIESPNEAETLRIPVIDGPSGISWRGDDVLLLATKTQDTEAALDALASVAPSTLPILCAQNSVSNERMAAARFANVYGVFVWCPADYLKPGNVRLWCAPKSGMLHVGCYPSGSDKLADAVAAAFRDATFHAEAKPDIMRWKYRKLLSNLGNAVDALCGAAARGSGIAQRARREGVACLEAGSPAWRRRVSRSSLTTRRMPRVWNARYILRRLEAPNGAAGRRGKASSAGWERSRRTTSMGKLCGWDSSTACRRL
jgi:2-dehydropantoate 2-reductase